MLPQLLVAWLVSAPAAAACLAAALAASRAMRSALHSRLCPAFGQSAWEQAVLQYHTAWQALQKEHGTDNRAGRGSSGEQLISFLRDFVHGR